MKKCKENKGITLIALIITIIVMLILVGVTVNVALNGGLFTTAKNATTEQRAATVEEKAMEWKTMREMDKYTEEQKSQTLEELVEDLENENLITEEEKNEILTNGQVVIGTRTINFIVDEQVALLRKYFSIGKNLSTFVYRDDDDVINFVDDEESISDASSSMVYLGSWDTAASMYLDLYIKYKDTICCVYLDLNNMNVCGLDIAGKVTDNIGKHVKYSYDEDENNEKNWLIIREGEDWIEIASPEILGNLTIGADNAKEDYNDSINIVNSYCRDLVTNTNKMSVRSLGSDCDKPDYENSKEVDSTWYNKVSGIESEDKNYVKDICMLLYLDKLPLFNSECLLASRRSNKK